MKMAVEWHREAATIELQRFTGNGQLGGKKSLEHVGRPFFVPQSVAGSRNSHEMNWREIHKSRSGDAIKRHVGSW